MIDKEKKPTLLIMAAGMGSRYGGLKQIDPVGSHGEIILDFDWHFASPSFCFVFWYNNAGSIMTE